MMRQEVTLEIEWDETQNETAPALWNWTEVLDTPAICINFARPVKVYKDPIETDIEPAEPLRQLVDINDLTYMQRVHPQTGKPLGPRIPLKKPPE
jgi:hypothetical protein